MTERTVRRARLVASRALSSTTGLRASRLVTENPKHKISHRTYGNCWNMSEIRRQYCNNIATFSRDTAFLCADKCAAVFYYRSRVSGLLSIQSFDSPKQITRTATELKFSHKNYKDITSQTKNEMLGVSDWQTVSV